MHAYPLNGNPNSIDIYKYNSNGKLFETNYFSDGKLISKWVIKRDINNNIIETKLLGSVKKNITYLNYDWENNWKRSIIYNPFSFSKESSVVIIERDILYY